MDELISVSFGPDRRGTAAAAGGVVVAAILAALAPDRPGRFLFALAGLLLLAYAVADLAFPRRLAATPTGLRIRAPMTRADLAWHEVEAVRPDAKLRFGLRSTALEIDAGQTLVVFSRRSLGADPSAVRDAVLALAPRQWAPR